MSLFALLRRNASFSIATSGLQMLSTLATVRLASPSAFSDLTIDIFKLAIVSIALEIVPSPYATIRWQQNTQYRLHMATFALGSSLFCMIGWAVIALLGVLSHFSWWMAPYAAYLGIQRYLDMMSQAENRIPEYYKSLCVAAALRLILTVVGLLVVKGKDHDVLWASLSLSVAASFIVWMVIHPEDLRPFARRGHRESVYYLFCDRNFYYAYYLNTALKRFRDSFLPVASSFAVADKVELARYLLAMRSVEFAMGQLRIVEAILANLANRDAIFHHRTFQLLLLAALAQVAAFCVGVFLISQTGFNNETLILSAIASFIVYPYVFEISFRSDAYAQGAPLRVSVSFATFAGVLAVTLFALTKLNLLVALGLVACPLLAQTVASLTYLATRRLILGRRVVTP